MVYIIEGIDGAGKTTLVDGLKELYSKTGRPVVFFKEQNIDSKEEKQKRLQRLATFADAHDLTVIYDRATAIDEFVYAGIVGEGEPSIDLEESIEALKRCTIIYLQADTKTITKRLEPRGDAFFMANVDTLEALNKRYQIFFENNKLTHYTIDTDNEELTKIGLLNWVDDIISRKNKKIAHIVPVDSLHTIKESGYVMCLAHLVPKSDKYAEFYSNHFGYVLMDNGAAEDEQLDNEKLFECYQIVNPDEIVLPDTVGNKDDTLRKMREALMFFIMEKGIDCNVMAVPQGSTFNEWVECADEMIGNKLIDSIGVSKFLTDITCNIDVRYVAVKEIKRLMEKHNRPKLEVHLLGCSESMIEIKRIMNSFPFVRGMDTAFGYLCIQSNTNVNISTSRPKGEIDFLYGRDYNDLRITLNSMETALGIKSNRPDRSWDTGAPKKEIICIR